MKANVLLPTVFLFAAGVASLRAESPAEREAKELKDQRDKAVASATKPIDDRYQASLEQLLSRAAQVKDTAGVETIKAELLKLGPLKQPPLGAETPAPAKLSSTVLGSWKVNDATGWTATFEFKVDGTCSVTPGSAPVPDYVVPCLKVRDKVELHYPDGHVVVFDAPKAGKMDGYKPDGSRLWAVKNR